MRLNTILVFVILIVFYFLVPVLALFLRDNDKIYRKFRAIYLSLFFIVLIIGVLGKIDLNKNVVYIGFDFSSGFFNKTIITKFPKFKFDIYINLIMLLPIGEFVFIENLKKGKFFSEFDSFLYGVLIGIVIEFLQFVLPVDRLVQISDIIYNGISSLIGFIIFSLIFYFYKMIIKLKNIFYDKFRQ